MIQYYINQVDKIFYKSIEKIKKAYKEMLPQIKLGGNIKVKNKTKNVYESGNKNVTFFSGSIDSYSTLIRHFEEKPDLITIWGADIDFENEDGWKIVKKIH